MIAPARYIQGNDVLDHLGRYLSLIPARHVAVLISSGGQMRIGDRVAKALNSAETTHSIHLFDRECSYEAVEDVVTAVRAESTQPDCLIAIGGGKYRHRQGDCISPGCARRCLPNGRLNRCADLGRGRHVQREWHCYRRRVLSG